MIQKLHSFKISKFSSSRLKRKNYKLFITLKEAATNGEVVKLGENELLRSVQRVLGKPIDFELADRLELQKKQISKKRNSDRNRKEISRITDEIDLLTYVPEIVAIAFTDKRHYQNILDVGLHINGKKFVRLMSGAGAIRRNTVYFVEKEVYAPLMKILNNGRDESVPLNPAKFNAYFGLYSSAGHAVSTPRFAVIPDHECKRIATLNWVNGVNDIEEKTKEISMNSFDGQGLISPYLSKKWGEELGLDHVSSAWIFRAPFTKGQVVTFDFHGFAENVGVEWGTDLWGNDFRICDVELILSESQFKMASSYESCKSFVDHMNERGLGFIISRYSPRELKLDVSSNYMFLQVLELSDRNIEELCEDTLKFFSDIRDADHLKTALYLSGASAFPADFSYEHFDKLDVISKALLLYPSLLSEKYISQRIFSTLAKKERQAKLGKLFFQGCYMPMISDPFAQAQHLCGIEVTGLLDDEEHYSAYWTDKNVEEVAVARSPLTHNSEMMASRLVRDIRMDMWYKYLGTTFIMPFMGLDSVFAADGDFDGDGIATLSKKEFITCRVPGFPISYDHGEATRVGLDDELLTKGDTDGMGSKIGWITNTSSTFHAMKYAFEEGSPEREEIEKRLMLLRVFQGEEIDSAKLGGVKKPLPLSWTRYDKSLRSLEKSLIADQRPYFTRYLYDAYNRKYREEREKYNKYCWSHFACSFQDILDADFRTSHEQKTVDNYYKYSFFLFSESPMNRICWHVEKKLEKIHKRVSKKSKYFNYSALFSKNIFTPNKGNLEVMETLFVKYNSARKAMRNVADSQTVKKDIWYIVSEIGNEARKTVSSNSEELGNLAVQMMMNNPRSRGFAWTVFGDEIVDNLIARHGSQVVALVEDYYGDTEFMFSKFSKKMVSI